MEGEGPFGRPRDGPWEVLVDVLGRHLKGRREGLWEALGGFGEALRMLFRSTWRGS